MSWGQMRLVLVLALCVFLNNCDGLSSTETAKLVEQLKHYWSVAKVNGFEVM
jgi:hypothetical protein